MPPKAYFFAAKPLPNQAAPKYSGLNALIECLQVSIFDLSEIRQQTISSIKWTSFFVGP